MSYSRLTVDEIRSELDRVEADYSWAMDNRDFGLSLRSRQAIHELRDELKSRTKQVPPEELLRQIIREFKRA